VLVFYFSFINNTA